MKLYRFLSEEDTSVFCHKVSRALDNGGSYMAVKPKLLILPAMLCVAGRRP